MDNVKPMLERLAELDNKYDYVLQHHRLPEDREPPTLEKLQQMVVADQGKIKEWGGGADGGTHLCDG